MSRRGTEPAREPRKRRLPWGIGLSAATGDGEREETMAAAEAVGEAMIGATGAKRWRVDTDAVTVAGSGAPAPERIGD